MLHSPSIRLPAPRCAFTLVELLVVIGIIAILAGLTLATLGGALGTGDKAKTQALIANIDGSIGIYQTSTGRYPLVDEIVDPATGNPVSDPEQQFDASQASKRELVNSALTAILGSIDRDSFGQDSPMVRSENDVRMIVDPWEEPLFYQPWTAYVEEDDAIHPESYQLWSFGEDRRNDVGAYATQPADVRDIQDHFGDDIFNWSVTDAR